MSPYVDLTFDGPCARLSLKRPDKLNALDRPMIDALREGALAIEASSEARVAILCGEGKAFCAGGDIAAWGGLPPLEMWRDWTRAGHRAFEALARLRVPLIVALTGHAFGGGLELAAVGDIRIAESGVKLGLPESGLGMAPGWSGTQRLVRRFGASVVRRMALSGAMFSVEEGLPLGLVDDTPAATGRPKCKVPTTATRTTAAKPPTAPSQVLPGLTRGAILCRPKLRPAKKAPMSAANTSRSIHRTISGPRAKPRAAT